VNCPVESIVSVPCAGAVVLVTVSGSLSGSTSFLSTLLVEVTDNTGSSATV